MKSYNYITIKGCRYGHDWDVFEQPINEFAVTVKTSHSVRYYEKFLERICMLSIVGYIWGTAKIVSQ